MISQLDAEKDLNKIRPPDKEDIRYTIIEVGRIIVKVLCGIRENLLLTEEEKKALKEQRKKE